MTLDEAIYREEALAYSFGERYKRGGEPVGDLPDIEAEHKQMAEWLRELKVFRKFAQRIGEICVEYNVDMAKYMREVNADDERGN